MDLNHMASAVPMSAASPALSAELLNLLIVDDEGTVREGCQEAAESLGFQCFTAENADSAYKILDSRGNPTLEVEVILADGATGNAPPGCSAGCEIRPTCHSCRKIRPPARCTASVTSRQPATCSALWMPGVPG